MNLDPSLIATGLLIGVLSGGVYALMASGLTLIFGVMDIINIAQGAFVVLGAYLSLALAQYLHFDLFAGLLITMPVMFGLGLLMEWAFIRPLKRDRMRLSILVTFGLALLIEGVLTGVFTADQQALHAWYITTTIFRVGSYNVSYMQVFALALSVVLLAGLYLLVYRTKFGASLRATVQNRTAAQLIGIDVERVSAITFGIGAALAAAGGMAFGTTMPFQPNSHYDLISRLLVIIVLGGMGSLSGALVASLLLVVIEDVAGLVYSPTWSSTVFFIVLVIVLLVRPQGLFGQTAERKQ
jgi:branched-chain amino acid transport system permease protein